MIYDKLPKQIGIVTNECEEMMFYQYLPIKLPNGGIRIESRLNCFDNLISKAIEDFITEFGWREWDNSYIYLTAKRQYQLPNETFNRHGYHTDGFLTDDINYIWSDRATTMFNRGPFNLTLDDTKSLQEMEEQAESHLDVEVSIDISYIKYSYNHICHIKII